MIASVLVIRESEEWIVVMPEGRDILCWSFKLLWQVDDNCLAEPRMVDFKKNIL